MVLTAPFIQKGCMRFTLTLGKVDTASISKGPSCLLLPRVHVNRKLLGRDSRPLITTHVLHFVLISILQDQPRTDDSATNSRTPCYISDSRNSYDHDQKIVHVDYRIREQSQNDSMFTINPISHLEAPAYLLVLCNSPLSHWCSPSPPELFLHVRHHKYKYNHHIISTILYMRRPQPS